MNEKIKLIKDNITEEECEFMCEDDFWSRFNRGAI